MKFRNILLSVIISLLLVFSLFSFSFSASAAEVGYDSMYFIVNNTDNTAELSTYSGNDEELIIPDYVYGYKVTSIAPRVFYENSTLKEVYLPDTITTIGLYAFAFCSNLKSISLGENITNLAASSFFGCNSLEKAVVNCNIETLPAGTFEKCSLLKEVSLSDTITSIGNTAFMNCSSLEQLPTGNITSFGSNCFLGTSASEVVISDGVKTIPWMCFANCNELVDVTIPKSVESINDTAFYDYLNRITIHCYSDSYALQYAEDNKIDHIILDGDKIGDVNGDGVVDILDATEIQKYAAESTDFTDEQFELGDINDDGYCDVIDALLVQKSVIGAYEIPPIVVRY